mmetsp:Transcript_43548/g.170434  ORF Transcript_43548/g.170434 Transcript_43548/m.170434 type:complete len:99 (+) Transcript_43548:817-1113(+)
MNTVPPRIASAHIRLHLLETLLGKATPVVFKSTASMLVELKPNPGRLQDVARRQRQKSFSATAGLATIWFRIPSRAPTEAEPRRRAAGMLSFGEETAG